MISLEEFKKNLPIDEKLTEEEIIKLKQNMEDMAELFFEMWIEDRKKSKHST